MRSKWSGVARRQILQDHLPLLGFSIDFNGCWRQDPNSGIESGTPYFRRVPYLDAQAAGDHKNIWEINRHQHWVLLAQAFLFTRRSAFLEHIERQFDSWVEQNPYMRGINWTSALEVAFRAMSWVWTYHLAGAAMSESLRTRLLDGIYQHGCYLEYNLSVYFSPNTHLLGEAVVLHALGTLFPAFPRATQWRELGGAFAMGANSTTRFAGTVVILSNQLTTTCTRSTCCSRGFCSKGGPPTPDGVSKRWPNTLMR